MVKLIFGWSAFGGTNADVKRTEEEWTQALTQIVNRK